MTQNESAIEQINLGFNDQEDRLLLKVGLADKTEVAVWITRRVCKMMWNLLQDASNTLAPTAIQFSTPIIASPESKNQAIESFSREASEQKKFDNLDFKSEYIVDRQSRSEEPMLATQCLMVTIDNLPPQLELQCTNGQSVKVALTSDLVHAVTSMMQLATREAGWDLFMSVDSKEVSLISTQQTVH
jgi:hypothetical protein